MHQPQACIVGHGDAPWLPQHAGGEGRKTEGQGHPLLHRDYVVQNNRAGEVTQWLRVLAVRPRGLEFESYITSLVSTERAETERPEGPGPGRHLLRKE